jgi:putative hemolysin
VILLAAWILSCLLMLVCFVQILYLESMRLRTREFAALEFFKDVLERRLGYETEEGALVFSLIKHTLLVFIGALFVTSAANAKQDWRALGEGFLLGWGVMIGACYVLPQILYRRSAGRWVAPLTPLLRFIALLFRPLTALLQFMHSLFELSHPLESPERQNSSEEIEALISAGEEEGIIEKEDSKLIQNVVAFGDKRVREVMTPRPSIIAVSVDSPLNELRALIKEHQFSRIPVYEGELDRVCGFVHVRDLYELDEAEQRSKTVRDVMRA